MKLTDEQKTALSGKLTAIRNVESFEGGYPLIMEAVYPFHTLKLMDESGSKFTGSGDYTFTVTGDDKLIIEIPASRLEEYYEIGKGRVPLRFITVNKEFISYIRTLISAPDNKDDWNYLLNAKKVSAGEVEGKSPQQVYKCASVLHNSAGSEIDKSEIPEATDELINFRFEFEDGSLATVALTDKYISYNNRYYSLNDSFFNIEGMLFVEYFLAVL